MSANNVAPVSLATTDSTNAPAHLTAVNRQPQGCDSIQHVPASLSVGSASINVLASLQMPTRGTCNPKHLNWGVPPEIEQEILYCLMPHDLAAMKCVNRHFHAAATAASAAKWRIEQTRHLVAETLVAISTTTLSDTDFEIKIRKTILRTPHVGIYLHRINNPHRQRIVLRVLRDSTHLASLDVQATGLSASLGLLLSALLAQHKNLKFLTANRCGLCDADIVKLLQNPSIEGMTLCGNEIGAAAVEAISLSTTLKVVDLGSNAIGDDGARTLAASETIEALKLANCDIGPIGVEALANAATSKLRAINLSFNAIGDEGAQILAASAFETLTLKRCRIGPSGAAALASARNPRLASIDLRGNTIGAAAVRSLIRNSAFRKLHLPSCELDAETRKVLSDMRLADTERVIEFVQATN